MSDLVGNPEDRFSYNKAHRMCLVSISEMSCFYLVHAAEQASFKSYLVRNLFGFVEAKRPSKQFISQVGTEPSLSGYNQYFSGSKCVFAQGHNTAEVGIEPQTSPSRVRGSTTRPPLVRNLKDRFSYDKIQSNAYR